MSIYQNLKKNWKVTVFKRNQKRQIPQVNIPIKAVTYPKWTFAREGDNYWLVLEKTRMQFLSERAFWSWGKPFVLASDESLVNYKVWKKIGFAPGTLVRSMDGQFWYITGSDPLAPERRLVATPDFFGVLGFNANNAILVSQDELLFHKEGIAISSI